MFSTGFDNIFSQIQTSMLLNIPKTNNYYIDILLFPLFVGFLGNIIRCEGNHCFHRWHQSHIFTGRRTHKDFNSDCSLFLHTNHEMIIIIKVMHLL